MTEEFVRDPESAKQIEERTKDSTTAKYSNISPAKILKYDEYQETERLTCPQCGWNGLASEADKEYYTELFDISCPKCEKMLLIVS